MLISTLAGKLKHSGFRRYFFNTSWLFLGRVVALLFSLVVGIYMARYLGPNRYGLLNYILSFAGLFAFLPNLGIDVVVNRELVRHPEKRDALLGTGLFIKVIGGLLTIFVIYLASLVAKNEAFVTASILVYSFVFVFQSLNVIELFFQSQVLSKKIAQVQLAAAVIGALLKFILIYFEAEISWFVAVYLMDSIIIGIGFVSVYVRSGNQFKTWNIDIHEAKNILKDSWPLMLTTVSMVIYLRIDQVMIRHMLDDKAVGIYAAATKLSEVWYFIPGVICASLFPAIINAKKTSEEFYQARLQKLYSLMIWFAVAIAIPVTILAPFIIRVLFGAAYLEAVPVLRIYIWAGVGTFLSTAIGQFLIVENYTKITFVSALIGAVSNIILNFIFIPRLGMIGAAYATLISYSLVSLSVAFFPRTRQQINNIAKSIFLFYPRKSL